MKKLISFLAIIAFSFVANVYAEGRINQIKEINILLNQGLKDEALKHLDALLSEDKYNHRALSLRGNVYFSLNNFHNALADFNKLIELMPNNPKVYVDRSIVYSAMNQDKLACQDVKRALELDPSIEKGVDIFEKRNSLPGLHLRLKQGTVSIKNGSTLVKLKK